MRLIPNEWRWLDEVWNIPYPWYTSPCLKWLDTLDMNNKSIFEYGVGDSTTWFNYKGALMYGVESDKGYAVKFGARHETTEQGYIQCIKECTMYGLFDIIIIDGIYRDQCTAEALSALKPGGYLIIDNWKQPSVQAEWPLTEKLIEGMNYTVYKEPNHYDWQTLVLQK